ncbi:MAG TPA: CHRD domain-containing protein [Acetobacteraceae bacterium]|nr:CHRD domain-containing protein [Acetobacteraceae bacterium]
MFRPASLAAVLAVGFATGALAATERFHATLNGANEVPAKQTQGTGTMTGTLNTTTHRFSYDVSWKGLSGPATMAHFHGPAPAGQNAGIVVPLGNNPKSPIKGSVTLTPEQQQQLENGLWYVNVHTAANPPGEIRGQVEPVKK